MKKRIKNALIIFLLSLFMSLNTSFGFTVDDLTGNTENLGDMTRVGNTAISIISIVGSAASIVCLIILGIKYMMGSVEERAAYKKTLMPYVIGAIFVFGASTVTEIIYQIIAN